MLNRCSRNKGVIICTAIPILFLLLFYVFPILIMFVYSFWSIDDFGRLHPSWNLDQYNTFFTRPVYSGLLIKSIRIAVTNTLLCIIVAYPITYFIAKIVKEKWRYLMLFLVILPSWTSFLIKTLPLLRWFNLMHICFRSKQLYHISS